LNEEKLKPTSVGDVPFSVFVAHAFNEINGVRQQNNVSILYHYRYVTASTVYVAACGLEKFFHFLFDC